MKKNLLTSAQKRWLKSISKTIIFILKISNLEGLAYLLKTGCQWRLKPEYYGARQTIYYHFRTIGDKDVFSKIKQKLLEIKRLRTKGRNLRLLRSLIVKACVQDCQNPIERTISGLDNFRRLARNYEQFLQTAQIMAEFACMMLLLKHI